VTLCLPAWARSKPLIGAKPPEVAALLEAVMPGDGLDQMQGQGHEQRQQLSSDLQLSLRLLGQQKQPQPQPQPQHAARNAP
jgi:hypothetical protein